MNVKTIVQTVYHEMQQHYVSFRFLVWLKERGITRRINHIIHHKNERDLQKHPTKEMQESKRFFDENLQRLENVMNMLSDAKSKEVMYAVVAYRTKHTAIPCNLYSENDQYFVEDIVKLIDGEVFVDGGAYTGDTYQQLLDTAKKQGIHIRRCVAFEPDNNNYKLIKRFYGKDKRIKIYKNGLSDKEQMLYFGGEWADAKIVTNSNESTSMIHVVNIDAIPEARKATYIKMDIEGAEWDALHGAFQTITKNKPKLAICIYHSDEDMIRLIEYIHEIVPEYKLYVRHHSKGKVETVLYAIV